jgi:hypothetical protein
MEDRIENALSDIKLYEGNALFITLTAKYDKENFKSIVRSWKQNQEELPKFLQRLRRLGFKTYIWTREAHERGGCHVHLIAKKKEQSFKYFSDKKDRLRLDDETLRSKIKSFWTFGHLDIQVISSGKAGWAGEYIKKEIGKDGHIETAIARTKRGIPTPSDKKKLLAHYFSTRLKIRKWGMSRDLITHMNNPSEEELKTPPEFILIPKEIIKSDFFEPITGAVDPKSQTFYELNKIFDFRKALQYEVLKKFHERK